METQATQPPEPIFVNETEAARLLGLSVSYLQKQRHFRTSDGPPVARVGRRVVYPLGALRSWAAHRQELTLATKATGRR